MAPPTGSTSRRLDHASTATKGIEHSPQRSPRRPTMGILKNRSAPTTEPVSYKSPVKHQHVILNEVRESLTMPHFGNSCDDDSEVCDDDTDDGKSLSSCRLRGVDAIIAKSQRHTKATTTKVKHVQQEQAPQSSRQNNLSRNNDDRSIGAASTKSTKSTRSIASFFRIRIPKSNATTKNSATSSSNADDVSVAASTKSGWWKRSSMTPEVVPQRSPAMTRRPALVAVQASGNRGSDDRSGLQSFRIKKPEKTSVRGAVKNNDQLVADFFDVQSFASEPDFVGSSRLRKTEMNEQLHSTECGKKKSRVLETSSVVSNRSQRSNVFSKFFQRMRVINDEVMDIDEDATRDLSGTGIVFSGNSLIDDELTLCSGFDGFSQMSSVQDEYDNDDNSSQGSAESHRSSGGDDVRWDEVVSTANEEIDAATETPFIQKIMQRRKLKNEATILRDVVGIGNTTNSSPESSSRDKIQHRVASPIADKLSLSLNGGSIVTSQQQQRLISPTNRNKRLSTYVSLESPTQRAKALAQSGMKLHSSKSMSHLPSSLEPVAESATPPRVTRGLCRWNSNLSLNSDPSAPKRPTRGEGSEEFTRNLLSKPSPSPKKSLDKLFKTSQSMRNLTSSCELKSGSDEEDDDDSILSLLSGLLATWSAERDGINVTITQRLPVSFYSGAKLKSILKNSSSDSEEQKVDCRERYSVCFKTIEVREYERIVGDNPSCSKGPPISIGWGYKVHRHYSITDYEHLVRGPRRTKKEFHLAADRRTHLLVNEWKCSEEEIRKARREATYIQYCRAKTAFSGSRAAAKEAAFLRKANDRSKLVVTPQPNATVVRDQSETSLPKSPSRGRRTDGISSTSPVSRSMPSTPVNAVSASVRQKLLQV